MNGVLRKLFEFVNKVIYFKEETVNHKKVLEELHVIIRSIDLEHDIESEDNFRAYKSLKVVSFDSENMNLDKETKLKTMIKQYHYECLGHSTYQLDYDEYEKV